ncbi:MAG: YceD family protein [Burkholderiales bacterium]|jgi:uncharacterized protein
MPKRIVIDTVKFARNGQEMIHSFSVEDLQRVKDIVGDVGEEIEAKLEGGVLKTGKPFIDLSIKADLPLTCQRCLELMNFELNSSTRFIIAFGKSELTDLSDEPDDVEFLIAEEDADVVAMVEEELLLRLPMAAKHEDGKCREPEWGNSARRLRLD